MRDDERGSTNLPLYLSWSFFHSYLGFPSRSNFNTTMIFYSSSSSSTSFITISISMIPGAVITWSSVDGGFKTRHQLLCSEV